MNIDLVFLWVDGNDPAWLSRKNAFLGIKNTENVENAINCEGRFANNDELKYSLRSVEKHIPWINKIFIVTDQQIPAWLDTSNPKIQIVDHTEILPKEALPCYNSLVIEYFLWKIPNLSEYFLYANDDMFINADISPSFFFEKDGLPVVRLQRKILSKLRCVYKCLMRKELSTYQKQIIIASQLIEKKYGKYFMGMPHHNIDAYRKTDYKETVNVFENEINSSLQHHLRSDKDVQRVIFAYYSIVMGKGHLKYVNRYESFVISIIKKNYEQYFLKYNPALFCINDGENSTDDDRLYMKTFLEKYFPEKSVFEKISDIRIMFAIIYMLLE
ncbi:MAG: Stealth CR1 domain-containing protein [Prevotellaceae bacterium]|jgi:hypothetical protein|nr:Stealth CR1 domain-containing protein [Prevotellaceae bacterium]